MVSEAVGIAVGAKSAAPHVGGSDRPQDEPTRRLPRLSDSRATDVPARFNVASAKRNRT